MGVRAKWASHTYAEFSVAEADGTLWTVFLVPWDSKSTRGCDAEVRQRAADVTRMLLDVVDFVNEGPVSLTTKASEGSGRGDALRVVPFLEQLAENLENAINEAGVHGVSDLPETFGRTIRTGRKVFGEVLADRTMHKFGRMLPTIVSSQTHKTYGVPELRVILTALITLRRVNTLLRCEPLLRPKSAALFSLLQGLEVPPLEIGAAPLVELFRELPETVWGHHNGHLRVSFEYACTILWLNESRLGGEAGPKVIVPKVPQLFEIWVAIQLTKAKLPTLAVQLHKNAVESLAQKYLSVVLQFPQLHRPPPRPRHAASPRSIRTCLVEDGVRSKGKMTFSPDFFLLEAGDVRIVGDMKFKGFGRSWTEMSDRYQAITFASIEKRPGLVIYYSGRGRIDLLDASVRISVLPVRGEADSRSWGEVVSSIRDRIRETVEALQRALPVDDVE